MPENLICTFDSYWSAASPEWWGIWMNESDHAVTLTTEVVVDGVRPGYVDTDRIPGLHVCVFGGWLGFMGAKWKWRVEADGHETVELKGYDPYSPRVDTAAIVRESIARGNGEDVDAARDHLTWELYRWRG